MEEKRKEKYKQIRYKRELERYLNRLVNFAKREEREDYDAFAAQAYEKLQAVEKVPLYNPFYEKLERFVENSQKMRESEETLDAIKSSILREANLIRKSKRIKSYNRKEKRLRQDEDY